MTDTEAAEWNEKAAQVMTGQVVKGVDAQGRGLWINPMTNAMEPIPDFCRDRAEASWLIDWLTELNEKTCGHDSGTGWFIGQIPMGLYIAGVEKIVADKQFGCQPCHGSTPGESLVRAIVAYGEAQTEAQKGQADNAD